MIIAVIDGHGGGIGSYLIKRIREDEELNEIEIIALGVNSLATTVIMRAKANRGASGENAIDTVTNCVDIIIGSWGIMMANSMMSELTPKMAQAVSTSKALKLLLPLPIEGVTIIGYQSKPLPHLTDELLRKIREIMKLKER